MTTQIFPRRERWRPARSRLWLPLAVFIIPLVAATIFILSVLRPTWPNAAVALDAPAIPMTVADELFEVPPAAIRVAVQRYPGPHDRIDLAFLWPSLAPLSADVMTAAARPSAVDGDGPSSGHLFVTVADRGSLLSPVERLRTIYLRYLEARATVGPDGLAIASFRAGTPYEGEDLVYLDAHPENFFARCTRPSAILPGTCINERSLGSAEITLRFPRGWLSDWRGVAAGFERLVDQLHPHADDGRAPADDK